MNITGEHTLLIGSVLLFFSIVFGKAGYKFGVPVLLMFLVAGMFFGTDGLGIEFNSPSAVQFIGITALSIILFSGGMDTKIYDIKPVLKQGVTLATVGVLLTTLFTGLFIYVVASYFSRIVNLTLLESFLLAAVMSSTDSASVFSILRTKKQTLKHNLRSLLELESGSNDPMAYMLTILLIGMIQSANVNILSSVMSFFTQMSIGALTGFLLGKAAKIALRRLNVDNMALYPLMLLSFVLFIFSITFTIHGNGYLAVYIAGLVVGNSDVPHKRGTMAFFDGVAWLSQIVMFLALGLLVNPRELMYVTFLGLLVGVFMIFISRPSAVFLSLLPFKGMSTNSKIYISLVGLRGAVPIIFATYPMIAGLPNSRLIFNVVFFITILSLLIQGTALGLVARKLKLVKEETPNEEATGDQGEKQDDSAE